MTNRYLRLLVVIVGAALVVSGIAPYDRTTWWLEIFPILIGTPILVATYRRFPLTKLTYTLLAIHALILVVGGHYTYARVPLGFWAQNVLGLARNDYDRLGHFVQGFVPAILIREILLRTSPLRPGRWLFVLVTATCLAFSACYEFFEWWSALAGGHAADAFLGWSNKNTRLPNQRRFLMSTDAASSLAPPFQSCTADHIDRLSRIPHANKPHVEIPFAAPTERDGADAAELPGHARPVPCLVKRPVRLGAAHRQYPSVGDRVAGAPGSIPTVHSRGDGCDQRHDDGREPKPEGKPEHEDQHRRDADEPSETHEQREGRAEELDRGIGFLVGIADLGHDGSQRRGSLTPHEPLLRPKLWLKILRAGDHFFAVESLNACASSTFP